MKTSKYLSQSLVAAVAVWGTCGAFAADQSSHSTTGNPDRGQQGAVHSTSPAAGTSQSAHSASGKADHKDTSFIKEAAQSGQMEVQMGKLGTQNAQNQQVKQLAQRLEKDHSKANQELKQIAQTAGVTIQAPDSDKKDQHMSKLQNKSGAEFDKAYIEQALEHHQKDIRKYQQALQDVKDPDLRAYIQKTLPVLREHLQLAKTAATAVGVDQNTITAADRFLSEHSSSQQGLGTAAGSQSGTSSTQSSGSSSHDQDSRGTTGDRGSSTPQSSSPDASSSSSSSSDR
jgi:putative membrane protein